MEINKCSENTHRTISKQCYDPQTDPIENLTNIASPVISELASKTKNKEKEHGVALWVPPELTVTDEVTFKISETISGYGNGSVDSQTIPSKSPIYYNLHTHPKGSAASFSTADVRSMLGCILQHPPNAKHPLENEPIKKSFGVVSQPFGYPDNKAVIKLVTATDKILELDIDEQQNITKEILDKWNRKDPLTTVKQVLTSYDMFRVETTSVELPSR